jgi:hypothetical protein
MLRCPMLAKKVRTIRWPLERTSDSTFDRRHRVIPPKHL